MIRLKKHVDEDGIEYIWATDVFESMNEFDPKAQKAFEFLSLVEKVLNYFVHNTSTAFGNPDLAAAEGKVAGYCMAMGWDWRETKEKVFVEKGRRTLFVIEKPKIPAREMASRRENAELRREFGI